jgi:rubrerythrin
LFIVLRLFDKFKRVVETRSLEVFSLELKGSKTEENLLKSFAGESQARNRYTFFASVAKKEGYEQISEIFTETASNEKEHAELFFKYLKGGMVEITASYPAGIISNTAENLKEDFAAIANTFRMVAKVEKEHEQRYRKLLANVNQGKVFKKDVPIKWKCRNCGHVYEGREAPEECPVCDHAQSYFEVWCENY